MPAPLRVQVLLTASLLWTVPTWSVAVWRLLELAWKLPRLSGVPEQSGRLVCWPWVAAWFWPDRAWVWLNKAAGVQPVSVDAPVPQEPPAKL